MGTFIFCLIFIQVCIFFVLGFVFLATFIGTGSNAIALGQVPEPVRVSSGRVREPLLTRSEISWFRK